MCVYFHCAVYMWCNGICLRSVLLMLLMQFIIGFCCLRAIACGSIVNLLYVMNSAILLYYFSRIL
jgi:hypothetical protein